MQLQKTYLNLTKHTFYTEMVLLKKQGRRDRYQTITRYFGTVAVK